MIVPGLSIIASNFPLRFYCDREMGKPTDTFYFFASIHFILTP